MDLGLTQTIKQIQTLSPQMYMSMEILCMNSLDLEERIENELVENVALEVVEPGKEGEKEGESEAGPEAPETSKEGAAEPEAPEDLFGSEASFEGKVKQWDQVAREEYDSGTRYSRSSYSDERDDKLEALNNTEGRPVSLAEHLESQIHLLTEDDLKEAGVAGASLGQIRDLAVEIIYDLDERGYLLFPIEDIYQAYVERLRKEEGEEAAAKISLELMRQALAVVQWLDPPGVGGLDLKECLLLQLRRDKQAYPVETRIIENHLDDLANNRLPKIAKALEVSIDDVKAAVEVIASLNPHPGNLFGGEPPRYIKPDVSVEKVDDRYEVRVESDYLPRLRVSDYYRELYKRSRKDPEVKKFIKKKLESAEWLLAAIRQRQSTLERIAREVVGIQQDFFTHGISHLKPLKMVEVAERVGVHVSTISRAISGKYMQTPRGLLDMKFFFTGGTQKSDGTLESRGSIIQRIKEIIEKEDKHNPLSDIDIVNKLKEEGLEISRRTVTKYREAESVPSSRQRRAY